MAYEAEDRNDAAGPEAIDDGSATSVWFNAGGVFNLEVPVDGMNVPAGARSITLSAQFGDAGTAATVEGSATCSGLTSESQITRRGVLKRVDWRLHEIDEDGDWNENEESQLQTDDNGGTCNRP